MIHYPLFFVQKKSMYFLYLVTILIVIKKINNDFNLVIIF